MISRQKFKKIIEQNGMTPNEFKREIIALFQLGLSACWTIAGAIYGYDHEVNFFFKLSLATFFAMIFYGASLIFNFFVDAIVDKYICNECGKFK